MSGVAVPKRRRGRTPHPHYLRLDVFVERVNGKTTEYTLGPTIGRLEQTRQVLWFHDAAQVRDGGHVGKYHSFGIAMSEVRTYRVVKVDKHEGE